MKRTIALLVTIVLLSAGWSGLWFYAAGKLEEVVANTRSKLQAQGREVTCANQEISGFPFRISLDCTETGFLDTTTGVAFEAGVLKSAAQAYRPGRVIAELSGPAVLELPGRRIFDIGWQSMRSSLDAGLGGLEKFSVVGAKVTFTPQVPSLDAASVDNAQIHGRQVGENDLEMAVRSSNVRSPQLKWPEFNLFTQVQFSDIRDALIAKPNLIRVAREQGLSGTLHDLTYQLVDGGQMKISGLFETDRAGLLSGEFKIEMQKPDQLVDALKTVMPEQREMLDQISSGARLISAGAGENGIRFTITVKSGNASLGLFPLGPIPPLY